ncbi:heavy metal translocating P-type ATPase [Mangrovicella endophytica]|uniref:heavy metal translocating P-type ATPase n=1 Tax=Mangrovicella endophytica TaxID=2066697 RepID=UPI000C9E0FA8|nr:heavy metal translocating P-type ATPase [Mangrovicella endophytica]
MSWNAADLQQTIRPYLVSVAAGGLALGLGARSAGLDGAAALILSSAVLLVLAALVVEIGSGLKHGEFGLDVIAALSMITALVVGEVFAAAIVALMYAGGQYLEIFAERRARREMTALLDRVPRSALRETASGLEPVPIAAIAAGDRLMIRGGDTVPVDGRVTDGLCVLDESALTGEAMPVRHAAGDRILSGTVNIADAFRMVAMRTADQSTFAGVVRLVEAAQRSRSPMTRMADRYALGFLAATLLMAGAAYGLTGDATRAVAVLVVATPCPLILAVPVALLAGMSRAAAQGVLVKGAKALETLARIKVIVLDKTGTLTEGRPRLVVIRPSGGLLQDELLRLAASLDQASPHPIAQAIVAEAKTRKLTLAAPVATSERPGEGLAGQVDGRAVVVGGRQFVAGRLGVAAGIGAEAGPGELVVAVGVDGRFAGELVYADPVRSGMMHLIDRLRSLGVERLVLATGDRREVAAAASAGLGFDAVRAELTAERKVLLVLAERKHGPVMMIGDGVNDAPALAAADLGLAMGARGAAASAEAADMVLLVDDLARVLPAMKVARRTRHIALQSALAGISLSTLGMLAAAAGQISPVEGALLQEAIDVAVILNALRALGAGRRERRGTWLT